MTAFLHYVNGYEENLLTARYMTSQQQVFVTPQNLQHRYKASYCYINMITNIAINIKYHDIYPSGKVHVEHKIHPVERNKYSTLSIYLFLLHYSANRNFFPPYYDRTSVSVSLVYCSQLFREWHDFSKQNYLSKSVSDHFCYFI